MQKNSLTFNLNALKAYSAGLLSAEQWQAWAAQPHLADLPQGNGFKADKIPMMQARRMGLADKMAIQLALELNESQPDIEAVVFASRHGQLQRTHKLLSHFLAEGEMSPTDFATAVHNAPAGQFSILAKQIAPISSVAAGADTFCFGLLDALLALQDGKRKVLFVMFDGEVPELYRPYLPRHEQAEPYALAMVLSQGDDWRLAFDAPSAVANPQEGVQSLLFLQQFYQRQPHFNLTVGQQQWQFSRR